MRKYFFALTAFLILMTGSNTATAQSLSAGKKNLAELQGTLENERQKKEELQRKAQSIERDLADTRTKLVKIGQSVQENERALNELESRISVLGGREKDLNDSLKADRTSMAGLVLALERLRRVPPEALIVRPGAPLQAAQSALLMKEIIPALHLKAEKLRITLAELQAVRADLEDKHEKEIAASESLKRQREDLSRYAERRKQLYAQTQEDLKQQQDTIRRISLQAQNLQDLVRRLNGEEKQRQERDRLASVKPAPLPRTGSAQLPVAGLVLTRYGDPDAFGAESKGITFETADESLVVAPMGGIVRFAGTFRNYGQLIIIEHEKGFHSLIAGLKKIDTVVGQSVAPGEPLGLMGRTSNGRKPTLYYELRLNGQPVNPARKFTDLG